MDPVTRGIAAARTKVPHVPQAELEAEVRRALARLREDPRAIASCVELAEAAASDIASVRTEGDVVACVRRWAGISSGIEDDRTRAFASGLGSLMLRIGLPDPPV